MFGLYVVVMALVTYLIRMLPFTLVRNKINNKYIKSFLHYVPYAVLGAMTFPAVIYSTGNIITSVVGVSVAVLFAWFNKSLLKVAIVSCASAYICGLFV